MFRTSCVSDVLLVFESGPPFCPMGANDWVGINLSFRPKKGPAKNSSFFSQIVISWLSDRHLAMQNLFPFSRGPPGSLDFRLQRHWHTSTTRCQRCVRQHPAPPLHPKRLSEIFRIYWMLELFGSRVESLAAPIITSNPSMSVISRCWHIIWA